MLTSLRNEGGTASIACSNSGRSPATACAGVTPGFSRATQ